MIVTADLPVQLGLLARGTGLAPVLPPFPTVDPLRGTIQQRTSFEDHVPGVRHGPPRRTCGVAGVREQGRAGLLVADVPLVLPGLTTVLGAVALVLLSLTVVSQPIALVGSDLASIVTRHGRHPASRDEQGQDGRRSVVCRYGPSHGATRRLAAAHDSGHAARMPEDTDLAPRLDETRCLVEAQCAEVKQLLRRVREAHAAAGASSDRSREVLHRSLGTASERPVASQPAEDL